MKAEEAEETEEAAKATEAAETAEAMDDEDGVIHKDKEKIKQIYAEHYKKLLHRPKSNTKIGKETTSTEKNRE